ncbi:MAG: nucleotidyltransferase domain-containing protein [Candidatus Hydrogenedentes bacterium]|nr:nucleotidyltransferase domain-containing protein [Candidatus Hydrogenedentota bacterium]
MVSEFVFGDKRQALVELCRTYAVHRLESFGSATNGSFDARESDLDFLVTFEPCTPGEHYERYFGLLESLESLFGRTVDLVEAQAMRNPYFIRQVNESRKLLYAA